MLQTLSIIIQNISSETGTYFLFSNNHVNNILEITFDFEDEEVLGFYISFLKAISLKLNPKTSQFFVKVDELDGSLSFPLYDAAVKFAHHKEGMVRAGVRTMTLSIFQLQDPYVDTIITRPQGARFFAEVANYLSLHIKVRVGSHALPMHACTCPCMHARKATTPLLLPPTSPLAG